MGYLIRHKIFEMNKPVLLPSIRERTEAEFGHKQNICTGYERIEDGKAKIQSKILHSIYIKHFIKSIRVGLFLIFLGAIYFWFVVTHLAGVFQYCEAFLMWNILYDLRYQRWDDHTVPTYGNMTNIAWPNKS